LIQRREYSRRMYRSQHPTWRLHQAQLKRDWYARNVERARAQRKKGYWSNRERELKKQARYRLDRTKRHLAEFGHLLVRTRKARECRVCIESMRIAA
jgi:hypothetical protein